jgi:hypothetical protein
METSPLLWNSNIESNSIFLELYDSYIKKEWKEHYFNYDTAKGKFKKLEEIGTSYSDILKFDTYFHDEVRRVDYFLMSKMHGLEEDLLTVHQSDRASRTLEKFLKRIIEKCLDCKNFYDINYYVICKIAAKFEKIRPGLSKQANSINLSFAVEIADSSKTVSSDGEDEKPMKFSSPQYINTVLSERGHQIHNFTKQCMTLHSSKFHVTYPALTLGEVRFVKNKAKEHGNTKFEIGIKLGLVAMMVSPP